MASDKILWKRVTYTGIDIDCLFLFVYTVTKFVARKPITGARRSVHLLPKQQIELILNKKTCPVTFFHVIQVADGGCGL
jgi:hypothetical protein